VKKVIPIFLITFLLANGAGFYIYFYFRLNEIKKEMHAEMLQASPDQFQRIVLTIYEYEKAKEGDDEVEWKDSMYDIASIQFQDGHVEILALRDDLETELLSFASRIIEFSTRDSKTPPASLIQYLSLTFTLPSIQANWACRSSFKIIHNTLYQPIESNPATQIILPPPRG
jgi:hypothetical protein